MSTFSFLRQFGPRGRSVAFQMYRGRALVVLEIWFSGFELESAKQSSELRKLWACKFATCDLYSVFVPFISMYERVRSGHVVVIVHLLPIRTSECDLTAIPLAFRRPILPWKALGICKETA